MAWIDKLNRKYSIEVAQPKEKIIAVLNERIEEAKRNKSWFSFNSIDYKNMQIDAYRAVIKRSPAFISSYNSNNSGYILLHFNGINSKLTKISIEIRPEKIGLWIVVGILVLLSGLFAWLVPGLDKYIFLTFCWVGLGGSAYISIVFSRYRLTAYLKSILEDISISNELKREN
jgi:hypothetical protein